MGRSRTGGDQYDYNIPVGRDHYGDLSRRPVVTRTHGHGNRTRFTVETGGASNRYRQDQSSEDDQGDYALGNRRLLRTRSRRPEVNVYQDAIPRRERVIRQERIVRARPSPHRYPSRTPYSSPAPRPRTSYSSPSPPRRRNSRHSGGDISLSEKDTDGEVLSSEDAGGNNDSDYDFQLPQTVQVATFSDEVNASVPIIAEQTESYISDKFAHGASPNFNGPLTSLAISHSRWQGNTFERGELGAEISITTPRPDKPYKMAAVPFLTWHHLERTVMSFEEFVAASQTVLNMPDREKRNVTKLLKDVQQKFEKPRDNGRTLEANCVSDVFYSDGRPSSKPTSSVVFLSFPYFGLETYSSVAIKALTAGSPIHPVRPLLQSYFISTSQTRELSQAITSLPSTAQGDCVHIAQVWCLLVDGTTLVTCSPLSIEALCGEMIEQKMSSPQDENVHIKVSLSHERSWLVPANSHTSWPAFLSLFGEQVSGVENLGFSIAFEYENQVVDGALWPNLLERARISTVELSMKEVARQRGKEESQYQQDQDPLSQSPGDAELEQVEHLDGPDGDLLLAERKAQNLNEHSKPPPTLLSAGSKTLQAFKHVGGLEDIRKLADDLHNTLMHNSRSQERQAYRKAGVAKPSDIDDWLTYNTQTSYPDGLTREAANLLKIKRKIASLSSYLYCFFWPMDVEHPTIDKYWAALLKVLKQEDQVFVDGRSNSKADLAEAANICKTLRNDIFPVASALTNEFLTSEEELRPLSDGFSKAWLHLVTAITLLAETPVKRSSMAREKTPIERHLDATITELSTARQDTEARLRSVDLEDLEVCTGESIIALLVNKVSEDIMRGSPDISTVYNDFYQSLEFKIGQDPVPRSHQQKLRFFLQEVEAILATLENQLSVLEGFQQSLQPPARDTDWFIFSILGESRQSTVIEECKAHIGGRIDKFKGLQKRAEEIGEWHRNEMETNRDRQENAIMVFTIVTIIFLPLSFVASVFGMNTNDIRNMSLNQWAYWAAGIPLTVVVIVGSLWWAGEFEGFGSWLARTMSRSRKSAGYEKLSEAEADADASRWRSRHRRKPQDSDIEGLYSGPTQRRTWPSKVK